jgi:hypothetical protein
MRKVKIDEFRQKPLRVHSFLAGVPLRTLARVDLLGRSRGDDFAGDRRVGWVQ